MNGDGKPWNVNYVDIEGDLVGKDCVLLNNQSITTFFIRKGQSCSIDVTFVENDIYNAKTETLRLFAEADAD